MHDVVLSGVRDASSTEELAFVSNRSSSMDHFSLTDNLAFFFSPPADHQVGTALQSQTTLLFFYSPPDHQLCAMLPTQRTLLSFPNRSSSVCDTSNTDNELVFPWLRSRRFPLASTKKVTLELWFKMDFILLHRLLPFGVAAAIILIWPALEKRRIPAESSLCSGDHLFG